MHVDGASLVCGLLLGGALWQGLIGIALIRRGHYRPSAWANPDLPPRSQGWGFVLISGTFTLTGISYLVSPLAGVAVLIAGIVITQRAGKRMERRASAQRREREEPWQDPSGAGTSDKE